LTLAITGKLANQGKANFLFALIPGAAS